MPNRFEELERECNLLLSEIDRTENYQELAKLKRELYNKKIEMIDVIEKEDKNHGITARELIAKMKSAKPIPRYALGLSGLDEEFFGGIEVGTLIQLAGQSFAGKTHFVLEVLSNIAGYAECVLFNFEMGDKRIGSQTGQTTGH